MGGIWTHHLQQAKSTVEHLAMLTAGAAMRHTDQRQSLVGEIVEAWFDWRLYRRGLVDAAMPDARRLGLAREALFQREFIDAASGFEVWASLKPRSKCDNATPDSKIEAEVAEAFELIPAWSGDAK